MCDSGYENTKSLMFYTTFNRVSYAAETQDCCRTCQRTGNCPVSVGSRRDCETTGYQR
jgi:hypothetical protein